MSASWTLTDPDGSPYQSDCPGLLGGHRRSKIYGRLECRSALQALALLLSEAATLPARPRTSSSD